MGPWPRFRDWVCRPPWPSSGRGTAACPTRPGGRSSRQWPRAVLLAGLPVFLVALRLPVLPVLLVTATTVAVVLASRWLGEFQGTKRFGLLALAMSTVAIGRYGGVVVGLVAGAGVTGSLALGAVVGWLLLPGLALLARRSRRSAPAGAVSDGSSGRLTVRAVAGAGGATLAMLATSYADLILARGLLAPDQAGAYAVGAVLTKGALWAPQVVTLLVLPWLAQGSRRALAVALGAVSACRACPRDRLGGRRRPRHVAGRGRRLHEPGAVRGGVRAGRSAVRDRVRARQRRGRAKVRWPGAPLWVALVGLVVATRLLSSPTVGSVLAASAATATLAVLIMSVNLHLRRR